MYLIKVIRENIIMLLGNSGILFRLRLRITTDCYGHKSKIIDLISSDQRERRIYRQKFSYCVF